jgi:hypothetical protein
MVYYVPRVSAAEFDDLLVALGTMTEKERETRAWDRIFANMTRRARGLRRI